MANAKALGIIFCNINDEYLGSLTTYRTLGSVPFGSRFRFIDFILSSMTNAKIEHVGVVTKSNYQSLMDHLGNGRDWDLARKREGLYILPPFGESTSYGGSYRGKLDALWNIKGFIAHSNAEYVVLAEADTILNIDLKKVIEQHAQTKADVTVVYKNGLITKDKASVSTLIELDEEENVTGLKINPRFEGRGNTALSITVINKNHLEQLVADQIALSKYSLQRDIIQKNIGVLKIKGYKYDAYASKIRNMNDYYNANMDLLKKEVRDELFLNDRAIFSKVHDAVPAVYGLDSSVSNSLIGDACVIEGKVENSILFRGVKVGKNVEIKNSIVMQTTTIEDGSKLDYCVIDKNVLVKEGRVLTGYLTHPVYIAKGSQV